MFVFKTSYIRLQLLLLISDVWNEGSDYSNLFNLFLSYFFVKKIPLSRRVGYVMDGSMGE